VGSVREMAAFLRLFFCFICLAKIRCQITPKPILGFGL
jgi:hypothetical protein